VNSFALGSLLLSRDELRERLFNRSSERSVEGGIMLETVSASGDDGNVV